MIPRTNAQSRIARAVAAHAMRVALPENAEWTRAMIHEQEYLAADTSALSWALGCVFVSYRGRLAAMTRLPDLPRWLRLTILLSCLGPTCAYFVLVAVSTAQGYPLLAMRSYTVVQEGLIFGSAALIGPVGLAAAFWTLSSSAHRLGTVLMVVLWLLTTWTLAVYLGLLAVGLRVAHVRGEFFTLWLTLFVPFVLLPALAVTQLQWHYEHRRRPLGFAGS